MKPTKKSRLKQETITINKIISFKLRVGDLTPMKPHLTERTFQRWTMYEFYT